MLAILNKKQQGLRVSAVKVAGLLGIRFGSQFA